MHLLEEQDDTQGICDCVELITGASPEALLQCCTGNRLVKWQAFANEASRQAGHKGSFLCGSSGYYIILYYIILYYIIVYYSIL